MPAAATAYSVLVAPEQNLIFASTENAYVADQLLCDFVINSAQGDVPLRGHLKKNGEKICYSFITVANLENAETLNEGVQWRQGTILEMHKFGTSNKARLTFAGKVKPQAVNYNSEVVQVKPYLRTIPVCCMCGTMNHRTNSCPNPTQDKCGLCGQQAPFVEGVRAPHDGKPKCAFCGGSHATNFRDFREVWACPFNPAIPFYTNPTREDWEETLRGCSDLPAQKALVERAQPAANT